MVYSFVVGYADSRSRECTWSQRRMAKVLGIAETTVRRSEAELEKQGWLSRIDDSRQSGLTWKEVHPWSWRDQYPRETSKSGGKPVDFGETPNGGKPVKNGGKPVTPSIGNEQFDRKSGEFDRHYIEEQKTIEREQERAREVEFDPFERVSVDSAPRQARKPPPGKPCACCGKPGAFVTLPYDIDRKCRPACTDCHDHLTATGALPRRRG
jgi:hypothetical protein